jgi:hypothetical protein
VLPFTNCANVKVLTLPILKVTPQALLLSVSLMVTAQPPKKDP